MALPVLTSPPRWLVVTRSAVGAYFRSVTYTVAALFGLFGGVQLAARTGSPLAVGVALTVLLGAGLELLFPGTVTRGTLPLRLCRQLAAVPLVLTWAALAVVLALAGSAAVAEAATSLRAVVLFCGVFMAPYVAVGLWHRDPTVVPAFRAEQ